MVLVGTVFLGSCRTKIILNQYESAKVFLVDNLLSSERFNLQEDSEIFKFIEEQ